jgi:predicted lipid-binding transport protein (Tim44 family)
VHAFAAAPIGIVPRVQWVRRLMALFVLTFGLLLWAEEADARLLRETRFAEAWRAIATSELVFAPDISPCAAQPAYPGGSLGDLFSRPGLLGGFAAGFLGAGVVGVLFGHGLIGELSGVPSILGLFFQFALLVALGWLIWAWWRADKSAAATELSPRQLADAYGHMRNEALPAARADEIEASSERDEKLRGAR